MLKKTRRRITMSDRAERMIKSSRARKKRKLVKEIRDKIKRSYYAHMKHLRQKYNKIKLRHHGK
jgi:hypothetical protein